MTCTHAGEVEPGDELPGLTIKVKVHTAAAGIVTNTAAVFSNDDGNAENDVAEDPTDVRLPRPDLTIDKSHAGNFTANSNGSWTIKVRNVSDERADGPTTVTDELPAGLQYVSGGGSGWNCGASGQTVTCTNERLDRSGRDCARPDDHGEAADSGRAAPTSSIRRSSANADDTVTANNSDSDPTAIDFKQAATTKLTASPVVLNLLTGSNKIWISAIAEGQRRQSDPRQDPAVRGRPLDAGRTARASRMPRARRAVR